MLGSTFIRHQTRCAFAIGMSLVYLATLAPQSGADVVGNAPAQAATQPIKWERPIEEKCFYLLTLLDRLPEVRQIVLNDPQLAKMGFARRTEMTAEKNNAASLAAATQSGRWTDIQIDDVGPSLVRLLSANPIAGAAVLRKLRESGMFVRERTLSDDELILHAWKTEARGMNHIIDVYGQGLPPAYPKIDSISFDPASTDWAMQAAHLAAKSVPNAPIEGDLFFASPLRFASALLDANGRNEAGRFEPMSEGENKAGLARVTKIDWGKFSYSCILVPGIGPEIADEPLSPGGRANAELAAQSFKAGVAPLIIVSGGYVHPNKTRFCEAVEMRRELIEKLGVPANAVLIEPHARHTTTNLRNAARLVYRYGIPFDKPAIVNSNASQIAVIAGPKFAGRCRHELGYQPVQIGNQPTPQSLEVRWNIDSLEADPMAPLDP